MTLGRKDYSRIHYGYDDYETHDSHVIVLLWNVCLVDPRTCSIKVIDKLEHIKRNGERKFLSTIEEVSEGLIYVPELYIKMTINRDIETR